MDSLPSWLARLASTVGPAELTARLGDTAWEVTAGGRRYVAKLGGSSPDEAEGLEALRDAPGAPPVPEVVLVEDDLLVTAFVEPGPRTPAHEEAFGRMLAALHRVRAPAWGGGSRWIGACRVDAADQPDAAAFYGTRLRDLAVQCGLERAVQRVASRLEELLPLGGPALVHGDLWWGNVLFGRDGRSWLIDPSVHGGHPEEDLAMLALFGPVPHRLLRAYEEVEPLPTGWEQRVELFQLYPLLVHAVQFGGGYRERAESVARHFA